MEPKTTIPIPMKAVNVMSADLKSESYEEDYFDEDEELVDKVKK